MQLTKPKKMDIIKHIVPVGSAPLPTDTVALIRVLFYSGTEVCLLEIFGPQNFLATVYIWNVHVVLHYLGRDLFRGRVI